MKSRKHVKTTVFVALMLVSCSFDQNQASSSLSTASENTTALSSSKNEKSEITNSSLSSSDVRSSPLPSSKPASSSSLDGKIYHTVSIFQSYYVEEDGAYGNPRFDFSVKIEEGKPLYANSNEHDALTRQCNEIYHPNGGYYLCVGFYSDVTCTSYITSYMLVESDMNAYYYCEG